MARACYALILLLPLALAACDSAEERAEAHYQRALALAADGETERATVEFRNVFRLNGRHAEARLAYARLLREAGEPGEALRHYLRLVEEDRRHAEGHRELAALALELQDFATAEEHAARAHALAPGDPLARALKAAMDLRRGEAETAVAMAEGVLADAPDLLTAHMVLVADRMAARDYPGALGRAEAGLAALPGEEALHLARLAALESLGDEEAVGAQLGRMVELFPDNAAVARALVAWHMRADEAEAAEALLRDLARRRPAEADGHLLVVQFLYETGGPDAARAELEALIAAVERPGERPGGTAEALDPAPFRRALAGLDFATGREAAAIAALEALVAGSAPSDSRRDTEVALAGMLRATGRRAEAAERVAGVLAADPAHVEALKLRAEDHVASDRPEAAIADLRAALAQAPDDPEIMTLMAQAHLREGARDLAGERLARAVEASGRAPAESIRYARFLLEEGRPGPAEATVLEALRRSPADPDLLVAVGEIHLARGDAARLAQTARLLREQGGPEALAAASRLEMAALGREGRRDEQIALLERLAEASDDARLGLVRAHAASGDLDAAEAELDRLVASDPDALAPRLAAAGLRALRGDAEAAEAGFRALAAAHPARPEPHGALAALLAGLGRLDEAEAALDAGIAATAASLGRGLVGEGAAPGADSAADAPADAGAVAAAGTSDLLFAKAGLLEMREDFEGAIALYETLYARDTANLVFANNLASLIATHRDDAESLERAHAIARRLRGSDVPQFQDTWGWILHRRGASAEALAYLEPAAAALGSDPLVQYHLGMAYLATGRPAEARAALERAVALAGEDSALPQIATARARLAELRPAGAASDG